MEKLHFSINIKAPKEKVWSTMLSEDSFRDWTEEFMPGSHYVGDWNKGSKISFLAPDKKGESGMVGRIRENRPYECVSIEYVGLVNEGKEDLSSEEVKKWSGSHEDYSFKQVDGTTEVDIDVDAADEYADMFKSTWPKALKRLKELTERNETGLRH